MLNSSPQRLQVFISSTSVDLKVEHSAAIAAILSCGHRPAGIGQFQTAGERRFPPCSVEQWIRTCDIYVLILGRCYGDLDSETGKSYVHLEYDYAVAQGMPIVACLMAADQLQSQEPDGTGHLKQLQQLRQQAQTHSTYYWREAHDLQQGLVTCLSQLTQNAEPKQPTAQRVCSSQTEALDIILLTLQTCTQSIQEAAGATQAAHSIADQTLAIARSGEASAQETVADLTRIQATVAESARTAKRLGESAQQMSKVMTLVNQLASRTNVIALNASIEVSRMGTRGEEFASVANDLRRLANHAAKIGTAVEQIVQPMQAKTNLVVTTLAAGMQSAIATTQPAAHTKETLEQLSQALEQLNHNVQRIAQSTVEQTAASTCMTEILQSLNVDFGIKNDSVHSGFDP
jgi:hypothetical protein